MKASNPRIAGVTLLGSSLGLLAYCANGFAQSQPQEAAVWDVTLGAGAMYHPDYEGSDDYEVDALPLLAINYRDFIKLRGSALTVDFLGLSRSQLAENLSVGALVKFDMGREADDNPVLRQLIEIDQGAEAGLFAEYKLGPVTFEMTAVHDLGTRHEGTLAELKIGYGRMLTARLHGQLGVMAAWADDNYTQTYFGISAIEAQASGLRPFAAKGGVKDAGVGASLNYIINENWRVTGLLAFRRLLGDAADSPLVEDEGSRNQASGAIIVGYAF